MLKCVYFSAIFMTATAVMAWGNSPLMGLFVQDHSVYVFWYSTQEACERDQGEWNDVEGPCLLPAQNTVEVQMRADAGLFVTMDTIHTNGHMCFFEGPAEQVSENRIVASAPGGRWGMNEEGEWDFIDGICSVTLEYASDGTVSGWNNGQCQDYCGANGFLDIEDAVRR